MNLPQKGRLLRIFVGENDRFAGRPLPEAIVEAARERGLAGATVLKGYLGFGRSSRLHTAKILRLSSDLPIVIEIVDEAAKIDEFLPVVDSMIGDGLVTVENVEVFLYRGGK